MQRYGLNKGLFWLISLALLLSFSLVMAVPVAANGTTYYVNDSTGDNSRTVEEAQSADTPWKTIQYAINTVTAGDTINVAAGTYTENVKVNQQVTIIGAGAANTTVTAFDSEDHVFTVEKDNVVTISGFTVTGATAYRKAGIYLDEAESCNISANICELNYDGIYLDKSDSNTFTSNTANLNTRYGIYFDNSSDNTLDSNTANLNTEYGIYIDSSSNSTLTENTANSNTEYGIHLANSDGNTLTSNTANSNTEYGIYLANSDSNTLTENTADSNTEYGIYLANGSHGNTLTGNTANRNSECGIYLDSSSNNTLTSNTANFNTRHGIYLANSGSNTLTENTANSNAEYGIYLNNGSNNNTLSQNTINWNAEYGIYLANSDSNTLTENTAFSNARYGIYLDSSSDNTLTSNAANSNAEYGIYLDSSSNNTLTSNTANFNTRHGIYLDSSSNNTLTSNTANLNTRYGIYLDNSDSNTLTSNTVRRNNIGVKIQQSVDASTISMNFNNIYGNTNYGVDNTGGTSDVDAENNWWGVKDGPGGVGPGTGDAVSDNVDYDPWINAPVEDYKAETTSSGDDTVDAKTEADTDVDKSGAGTPTITVAKYSSNPGTDFRGDTGKYIDVHADTTTDVDEIIIKLYYTIALATGFVEPSLILRWWDGTSWVICSDSGITYPAGGPIYSGYMWAKIRSDTTPDLTQLTGSVFVGSGTPREKAVLIPTGLLSIDILGKISRVEITNAGTIAKACTVVSLEGELTLELDGGTRVICSNNQLPVLLEARPSEEPPPMPEGFAAVSPVYDLTAYISGGVSQPVTFDPPARLQINYSPQELPENVSSVFIAYHDEEQGWTQLESPGGFVAAAGEAAAQVSHFTPFVVMADLAAPPLPARFEVRNLDINPSQVKTGENITISAQVANIGGTSGEYTLMLNIEGLLETSRVIELAPGESREISFAITPSSPDSYGVEIGGLRGNFVAVPISPPEISEPEAGVPGAVSYGWLIAVIAAVAALAALAFIMATKRLQHALSLERGRFEKPAKPFTAATAERRLRRAPLVEKPAEPALSALLRVGNLKITPNQVKPGKTITVFAEATNTGIAPSSYSLVLKIKGIAEAVKEITLSPGQSQKIAFMIIKDKPDVYDVDLEDLKGSFTVEG